MKQTNFNSNPSILTYESFKMELGIIMPTKLKSSYTGLQSLTRAYEEISRMQALLNHNHHLAARKNLENYKKPDKGN